MMTLITRYAEVVNAAANVTLQSFLAATGAALVPGDKYWIAIAVDPAASVSLNIISDVSGTSVYLSVRQSTQTLSPLLLCNIPLLIRSHRHYAVQARPQRRSSPDHRFGLQLLAHALWRRHHHRQLASVCYRHHRRLDACLWPHCLHPGQRCCNYYCCRRCCWRYGS